MSGDTTIQALKRLSWLPERTALGNGRLIAGQEYDNVFIGGGTASFSSIKASDGTALLPSISFINDNNTGIYRIGIDSIGISTGGVGRFAVNDLGNVGIGTTTPSYKLDVSGNINSSQYLISGANALSIFSTGNIVVGSSGSVTSLTGTGLSIGNNSIFGFQAGNALTTGYHNTLFGKFAGRSMTTAGNNICIGVDAGFSITGSSHNMLIGTAAGYYITGSSNTAIGGNTLFFGTTCDNNVAIGYAAGYRVTTGSSNFLMGLNAGYNTTTGSNNLFVGSQAAYTNTTGGNNVCMGFQSGYSAVTTDRSVAIGGQSMQNMAVSGVCFNTSVGYQSMFGGAGATGTGNTAVGYAACFSITTGAQNTFLGLNAGYTLTTGSNNVIIGRDAGSSTLTTGSSNILIGSSVDAPAAGTSNFLNIGGDIFGDLSNVRFKIGGSVAVPTANAILDLSAATGASNSAIILPRGTTANRPTTPLTAMLRYNDDTNLLEYYHATLGWQNP